VTLNVAVEVLVSGVAQRATSAEATDGMARAAPMMRTATRRWLRGEATREATDELFASTLEDVLRTFGAPPAPRRRAATG
jgi:hypothetical protein